MQSAFVRVDGGGDSTGGLRGLLLPCLGLSRREVTHVVGGGHGCVWSGFSWHGVVVRLDAMSCGVSLPSITILHLSAPSAHCANRLEGRPSWSAYRSNRIFDRYAGRLGLIAIDLD